MAGQSHMLEKLRKSVQAGSFYEAQQMYKSVSARYLSQRKYDEALDLLQSGACVQLEHEKVNCGVELGTLLVDSLTKSNKPLDAPQLERLLVVFRAFANTGRAAQGQAADDNAARVPSTETLKGAETFLKAALRWSMKVEGGAKLGSPVLHDCLAQCYWALKDTGTAARHFALGNEPRLFATMLTDDMQECFPDEVDLFVARAVLQCLAFGNLRGANAVLDELREPGSSSSSSGAGGVRDASDGGSIVEKSESVTAAAVHLPLGKALQPPPLPDSPLMHFLSFLLLTLERDAYPLFQVLCMRYQPSLDRDPSFHKYLDDVAHRFYGVRKQPGGFLGNFMQMLMGGE